MSDVIKIAEKVCKDLNIIVKPVNTKEDIIKAKNFNATFEPTKKSLIIK